MNVKETLYNTLKSFGYPVFLQGTLNAGEAYPDIFITYFTDDIPDDSHYDNETTAWAWNFSVILYANSPEAINTLPEQIRVALKKKGFIPQGKGRDIPSDEPSHTGWAQDYIYRETK